MLDIIKAIGDGVEIRGAKGFCIIINMPKDQQGKNRKYKVNRDKEEVR